MSINTSGSSYDVFSAAAWLTEQYVGRGRAIAADRLEWECTTWGSGRGAGIWEETALFHVVAHVLKLDTYANREARNELVVVIPLEKFDAVARLIGQLGDEAESWPWLMLEDDDPKAKIELASEMLGLEVEILMSDCRLLALLRID